MNTALWTRIGAVYAPIMAALLARMMRGRHPRQFAACLLSLLWAMPSLLIVQKLNAWAEWWRFTTDGISFCGMPLELSIGWAILWGLLPQLAFPRLALGWSAAVMVAADLFLMPLCNAVVRLGPFWLIGEAAAVMIVLLPALCIARWTLLDTHLRRRAALQVATAGMLFLFFMPELTFALRPGRGWEPLLHAGSDVRQIGIQVLLLLAVPGISAAMEFAERGSGTPIPYDPPKRLVTSGMYRYCANPMQLSCALAMLLWAGMLRNGWLALAVAVSVLYSAGIAAWDEQQVLPLRFGEAWMAYRHAVRNWLPRWRPYHAGAEARLYLARSCGPCSELRAWIETRRPAGMQIVDAEALPEGSIRRMRYDPADGSDAVEGIRAMGRALEHLHLGWALVGATLRMPILWQGVQLVMDASGLGSRLPQDSQRAAQRYKYEARLPR